MHWRMAASVCVPDIDMSDQLHSQPSWSDVGVGDSTNTFVYATLSAIAHWNTHMPGAFDTPIICPLLIGRASELTTLDWRIAQVLAGQGQIILIAGEAGVGKSRLLSEAVARFRSAQAAAGA